MTHAVDVVDRRRRHRRPGGRVRAARSAASSFVAARARRAAGGVILSEQVDGFTIDARPDALLIQKPDGIAAVPGARPRRSPGADQAAAPRLHPARRAAACAAGGVGARHPDARRPVPPHSLVLLARQAAHGRRAVRAGAARRRATNRSARSSTRRFGREAATYLAEPLLAGIHAGDVDRLSMRALFPRFVEAERQHGSLLRAFRRQAASAAAVAGRRVQVAARRTERAGRARSSRALPPDAIRLRTPVVRVTAAAGGPFRVETAADATIERARPSCSPRPRTRPRRIAARSRRRARARCAARFRTRRPRTVALAFARDAVAHPLNGSGFVVPRVEARGILAASWLSSKWPHRAPDGRVLLRAFVGGARDPRRARAIGRRARRAIAGGARAAARHPRRSRCSRACTAGDRANAQHEVGHLARIAAIERALARHPGLVPHRQRFSRRRHPRLRRRRPRDRASARSRMAAPKRDHERRSPHERHLTSAACSSSIAARLRVARWSSA